MCMSRLPPCTLFLRHTALISSEICAAFPKLRLLAALDNYDQKKKRKTYPTEKLYSVLYFLSCYHSAIHLAFKLATMSHCNFFLLSSLPPLGLVTGYHGECCWIQRVALLVSNLKHAWYYAEFFPWLLRSTIRHQTMILFFWSSIAFNHHRSSVSWFKERSLFLPLLPADSQDLCNWQSDKRQYLHYPGLSHCHWQTVSSICCVFVCVCTHGRHLTSIF